MAFADENGLYRRFTRIWHILALILAAVTAPYLLRGTSATEGDVRSGDIVFGKCFFEGLTFLAAFAINFGMSVWVTFVAGVVMYRTIPVHTFGLIQSKLFPIYFFIGGLTGAAMLFVTFMQGKSLNKLTCDQETLVGSVSAIVLANVINGLWLTPSMTGFMFEKHRMEKEEPDKSRLDSDEEYKKVKKSFGMIHGISSLINLVAMVANVYILYWLAKVVHEMNIPKVV